VGRRARIAVAQQFNNAGSVQCLGLSGEADEGLADRGVAAVV